MRRMVSALFLFPVLVACGASEAPEEPIDMDKINEDARGPVERIEPDPLTFRKLSEHDLLGAGCNFTPDASEELVFVADRTRAHFLLENRLVGMSPDRGSRELPYGVRTEYDGLTHSAEIWLAMDTAQAQDTEETPESRDARESEEASGTEPAQETEQLQAPEVTYYRGTLEIRDPRGRFAYSATGQWQCGA